MKVVQTLNPFNTVGETKDYFSISVSSSLYS